MPPEFHPIPTTMLCRRNTIVPILQKGLSKLPRATQLAVPNAKLIQAVSTARLLIIFWWQFFFIPGSMRNLLSHSDSGSPLWAWQCTVLSWGLRSSVRLLVPRPQSFLSSWIWLLWLFNTIPLYEACQLSLLLQSGNQQPHPPLMCEKPGNLKIMPVRTLKDYARSCWFPDSWEGSGKVELLEKWPFNKSGAIYPLDKQIQNSGVITSTL